MINKHLRQHACRFCEHAEFNRVSGQFRCKRLAHAIDDPDRYNTCEFWLLNPEVKAPAVKRWRR